MRAGGQFSKKIDIGGPSTDFHTSVCRIRFGQGLVGPLVGNYLFFSLNKVVEIVGGGSVINRANLYQ